MNAIKTLEAYYHLTSNTSFEDIKKATRHALAISEPEQWTKQIWQKNVLKSIDKTKGSEPCFVVLEFTKPNTERGYCLLAIPVKIDLVNENGATYIHADSTRAVQLNPEYITREEQDGRPNVSISNESNALRSLYSFYEAGVPESWFKSSQALIFDVAKVQSISALQQKLSEQLNGIELIPSFALVQVPDSSLSTRNICNLYKSLLHDGEQEWAHTPLKRILTAITDKVETKTLKTSQIESMYSWFSNKKNTEVRPIFGHMDTQQGVKNERELFPLDNTQRYASIVAGQLEPSDGDSSKQETVIAVNGPPGSGKTSMLKAIIADMSVKAAINKQPCPIIVAAGATNQSVKNVMSAFPEVIHTVSSIEGVGNDNFSIYERWLPHINNYGSFLASSDAIDKLTKDEFGKTPTIEIQGKNKPYIFGWTNIAQDLSELSLIENIEQYYCYQAKKHFGKSQFNSAKQVKEALHDQLISLSNDMVKAAKHCAQQIREGNHDIDELFIKPRIIGPTPYKPHTLINHQDILEELSEFLQLRKGSKKYKKIVKQKNRERVKDEEIKPSEYIEKLHGSTIDLYIEHLLDTSYRPLLFQVAARYWEAEYILSVKTSVLFTLTEENVVEGLRRVCMVTPVVISTLHMLPKLLSIKHFPPGAKQKGFVYGGIDLLITDETGQADIRLGLPSLSLAKRLISVGDISQLEPVIDSEKDISQYDDYSTLMSHGFNQQQITQLMSQGFTPTSGSLLHIITAASSFSYQGKGFMLRGHYRCHEHIIDYCNQMVYENKLFYLPNADKLDPKNPLPPMSYVESPGKSTAGSSGSKVNIEEAKFIARLIVEKYRQWYKAYGEPNVKPSISSMVAIVTPFNAQPQCIRDALIKMNKEMDGEIEEDDIKNTTIDTIHKLQGAEKDIVIFSGVQTYDHDKTLFFERTPFLLNVAVSRAKQAFVAVICPKLYGISNDSQEDTSNSVTFLGHYFKKLNALQPYNTRLLPSSLFIVEAQGKVEVLSNILGQDYKVLATLGAITESYLESDDVNTAQRQLLPDYQLKENGQKILRKIIEEGALVDRIYLATDDDNVGEAIAWHLYQHLLKKSPSIAHKIIRLPLRSISKDAVKHALSTPDSASLRQSFDMGMVSAELSRDIIDRWTAQRMFSVMTKHANLHTKENIGIGRVKAAVLDTVLTYQKNKREASKTTLNVELKVNGKTIHGKIENLSESNVESVKNKIENSDVSTLPVDTKRFGKPSINEHTLNYDPPCRSTAEVIKYAYLKHNLKPGEVTEILQSLYIGSKK